MRGYGPPILSAPRLLIWLATMLLIVGCGAQSTCTFLKNASYLAEEWIPAEPIEAELDHCEPPQRRTCCTREVEAAMGRHSMAQLETDVRNHVGLLRAFFNRSEQLFHDHLRTGIAGTYANLEEIYTNAYGSFFTSQPSNSADSPTKIFADFFARLTRHFDGMLSADDNGDLGSIFDEMFDRVYAMEFLLMNPLTTANDAQLKCMLDLQTKLRPFGFMQDKVKLLATRGLNAWTGFLSALRRISRQLENFEEKSTLGRHCTGELTRMSQCHLCAGEAEGMRPCLPYCLNVLKGCLNLVAGVDRTFNRLIEALIRVASRMKTAHNPYNVLFPLPFQISEAIMHFQELGVRYSNQILLHCFQPEFELGRRRSFPERRAKRSVRENVTKVPQSASDTATMWKAMVWEFIDKLIRLKGFWRAIPRQLCRESGIATPEWGNCWNGASVVAHAMRPQRESISIVVNSDASSAGSETPHHGVQKEFGLIAGHLNALYAGGANYTGAIADTNNNAVERPSTLRWSDDEDYMGEGSGDDERDHDSGYYDDGGEYYQDLAPRPSRVLPASSAPRPSVYTMPLVSIVAVVAMHLLILAR